MLNCAFSENFEKPTPKSNVMMSGSEMITTALEEHGVQHIFGYPGGAILPLYDALYTQSPIHHTLVSHEQGAVHAAEGYARSTGKTGVVFATSGPGATNTVTGIMDAYADSIPLLVITGQVISTLIGTNAFQECNIVEITKPCTKCSTLVTDVADLPRIVHEALHLAQTGRQGPVLIDIPKDVQAAKGVYRSYVDFVFSDSPVSTAAVLIEESVKKALDMMKLAERPVFYVGGGVVSAGPEASRLLTELVNTTNIPITSSLMGLGAYPASGKNWLGMLGMHGTYEANRTMYESDLIIAIGVRFDDRVTGSVSRFAPKAKIIHVDIDPREIGKIVRTDLGVVADCHTFLAHLLTAWRQEEAKTADLRPWWDCLTSWKQVNSLAYKPSDTTIKPQSVLQKLNQLLKSKDVYVVTDVGQHQMWTAQFIGMNLPNRFMTSGGLGTMGYGLPSAIGVQTAHPDSLVVCVTGDGSLQMNSQEMMTAAQHRLPLKVLLLNNAALGMVRQWQEMFYENRCESSVSKGQPDFVKLAEAYGWKGMVCHHPKDLDSKLREWMATPGMCLLDCRVDPAENCLPIIPPGAAHNEMVTELPM